MKEAFRSFHFLFSSHSQITLVRRNKLKAIDQEPIDEVQENELRNETDSSSEGNEEENSESLEFTSNN